MSKDFYQEKLDEINVLILADDLKKASELVAEELRMPYIPKIYETKFVMLQREISLKMIDKMPNPRTLPVEELLVMLAGTDRLQSSIALEALRKHNLWPFAVQLKQIVEGWDVLRKIEKAFLFEVLCEQKIDIEIIYDKDLVLNPAHQLSIDKNENVQIIFHKIKDATIRNPQLQDVALEIADKYFLFNYPNFKTNDNFVENIKNISFYMLGELTDLTKEEMQILRDIETI